jgi:ribonuclease VapC
MLGKLNRFLQEVDAVVMPFDEQQARLADTAFQRYGKGQGHPAQLNLGDCVVYALAKTVNV